MATSSTTVCVDNSMTHRARRLKKIQSRLAAMTRKFAAPTTSTNLKGEFMFKVISLALLMAGSARAAEYTCKATHSENLKVLWVKHKAVKDIDYKKPIDPSLIIESKVLNKEGLETDVSKYGYHASSSGDDGYATVLFTNDYKRPLAEFGFSDDLRKAKKNDNPGYEWDYYLQMLDAKGAKQDFGVSEDFPALDQTAGLGNQFQNFIIASYDARSKRYDVQLSLMKMGFKKGGESVIYSGVANLRFAKGANEVAGEVSVGTGYVNDEDPTDETSGGMKNDSIEVVCTKK